MAPGESTKGLEEEFATGAPTTNLRKTQTERNRNRDRDRDRQRDTVRQKIEL